ncbi:MAG: putative peptidoglycan lipid II flippase, partial [Myxococcota bacterium]
MVMADAPERQRSFLRAFLSSALGTALSRGFGAARDIVTASVLGAGSVSDAFYVAWTIPNVFRRFVADEGLTGALIPALSQAEREEGEDAMRRLSAAVLGALLLLNVLFISAGILGADGLVLLFAWSWRDDPEQYALVVGMTRWLFPFLGMVSLVSFFEGLLNYRGHFFTPKLAPALVSLGIVIGALTVGSTIAEPVWALVGGALVGGVAHVLIHAPALARHWGRVGLSFRFGSPRLRAVLRELGKVVAIGVFAQINLLVLRQLATSLPSGSVSHYWNANRIVDLSQGVVAVAIGSALLPNVAAAVAEKDWEVFRTDLTRALRLALFLLLPVAVTLLSFSIPITAVVFRHGA